MVLHDAHRTIGAVHFHQIGLRQAGPNFLGHGAACTCEAARSLSNSRNITTNSSPPYAPRCPWHRHQRAGDWRLRSTGSHRLHGHACRQKAGECVPGVKVYFLQLRRSRVQVEHY
jgi:hypothetical protein